MLPGAVERQTIRSEKRKLARLTRLQTGLAAAVQATALSEQNPEPAVSSAVRVRRRASADTVSAGAGGGGVGAPAAGDVDGRMQAEAAAKAGMETAAAGLPPTGWVTLVEGHRKHVSSRLRLDVGDKREHEWQWQRRQRHDWGDRRAAETEAERRGEDLNARGPGGRKRKQLVGASGPRKLMIASDRL